MNVDLLNKYKVFVISCIVCNTIRYYSTFPFSRVLFIFDFMRRHANRTSYLLE